tara:strand:+ start:912 stop:1046 length:135 start_codon:yes stop_codon:yes gene_type:complete
MIWQKIKNLFKSNKSERKYHYYRHDYLLTDEKSAVRAFYERENS